MNERLTTSAPAYSLKLLEELLTPAYEDESDSKTPKAKQNYQCGSVGSSRFDSRPHPLAFRRHCRSFGFQLKHNGFNLQRRLRES